MQNGAGDAATGPETAVARGNGPPSLAELWALRTDWEDVPVASLGGTVLRVYALSGVARAKLMPEMAELAATRADDGTVPEDDSALVVGGVLRFQNRAVAASLGYPEEQWDAVGATLGSEATELLYEVVARLSGLDRSQQNRATRRLRPKRSAGSGTD